MLRVNEIHHGKPGAAGASPDGRVRRGQSGRRAADGSTGGRLQLLRDGAEDALESNFDLRLTSGLENAEGQLRESAHHSATRAAKARRGASCLARVTGRWSLGWSGAGHIPSERIFWESAANAFPSRQPRPVGFPKTRRQSHPVDPLRRRGSSPRRPRSTRCVSRRIPGLASMLSCVSPLRTPPNRWNSSRGAPCTASFQHGCRDPLPEIAGSRSNGRIAPRIRPNNGLRSLFGCA
jgi:hypothetical protein